MGQLKFFYYENKYYLCNKIKYMKLLNQINQDLKTAIKESNIKTKDVLRVLLGEVSRQGKTISDNDLIKIIKKMQENAADFHDIEEFEILGEYLPKYLNENELEKIINKIINDNEITSMKGIGLIMKELNTHPQSNQIDKKTASNIIKEKLS
jgi:uncharacterized protein